MRRVGSTVGLCALIIGAAGPAVAQGDAGTSSAANPATAGDVDRGGRASSTVAGPFPIRRGFFAEGDFGVFFAFGGRNTNVERGTPAPRATSNLEPTIGLTVGYDILSGSTLNLALGLRGAMFLNGGAGRVSAEDAMGVNGALPTTRSNDFSIYETGVAVQVDFYLSDRLSLATKLGGGLAILNPDPSVASATVRRDPIPGAGGAGLGGMGSAAFGVNYATLLTGFQVGLDIRFVAVFFDGIIPALSATVPIKYNF